jgi:conjugal transfer/entry exclusion protein
MQVQFINLWQNPAYTSISSTDKDPKVVKLLKQSQAESKTFIFSVKSIKSTFSSYCLLYIHLPTFILNVSSYVKIDLSAIVNSRKHLNEK